MTPPDTFVAVDRRWWLTNTGGVALTGVLAAVTGRPALRRLFHTAVAIHVGEALYSYGAARRAGFTASAPRWALQTLGVGFPSLTALRAARRTASAPSPSET
jgi:transmembrane protein TMEM254